ncbi:MAG: hypothetical protein J6S91_11980 [Treponema sp.]|nr:hypothetical protein [Treponema sp.]
MKRRITFLDNEYGYLSTGKLLAFVFDLFLALISYSCGKMFPMGLGVMFPIFMMSLPINIYFIVRSVKDNTFELLSLYLLPILIAFVTGIFVC